MRERKREKHGLRDTDRKKEKHGLRDRERKKERGRRDRKRE